MEDVAVTIPRLPDPAFWSGRRVLLTGHTGFKGSWLTLWLRELGATVHGIALPPDTEPSLYAAAGLASAAPSSLCDIRDADRLAGIIRSFAPEITFHLAAQAQVIRGYATPAETFATNVLGTVHVLDSLRAVPSARVVVVVTSDKVYRNLERPLCYREDDELGGHDPYSASKAAAEIVSASFRTSYFAAGPALATARAGNVIGGGDWADNRLIPDAVRAWTRGEQLVLRNPGAVRPWQHVLEPLTGYLVLAETLCGDATLAGAYNFGPASNDCLPVADVVGMARAAFGTGEVAAEPAPPGAHEAQLLALDAIKARALLGVAPRWAAAEAIQRTMRWYAAFAAGGDARALCLADIAAYNA